LLCDPEDYQRALKLSATLVAAAPNAASSANARQDEALGVIEAVRGQASAPPRHDGAGT
jgi:hypothetical protein